MAWYGRLDHTNGPYISVKQQARTVRATAACNSSNNNLKVRHQSNAPSLLSLLLLSFIFLQQRTTTDPLNETESNRYRGTVQIAAAIAAATAVATATTTTTTITLRTMMMMTKQYNNMRPRQRRRRCNNNNHGNPRQTRRTIAAAATQQSNIGSSSNTNNKIE